MKSDLWDSEAILPPVAKTIGILAKAMGYGPVPLAGRVVARARAGSPDEGLALIAAYREIDDIETRQAILDVIVAAAHARGPKTAGPRADLDRAEGDRSDSDKAGGALN